MPALDIRTAVAAAGPTFALPIKRRAAQNFNQDVTGDWVALQADGKDSVITVAGKYTMRLTGGGHNSQTGLVNVGGKTCIVLDWAGDLCVVPLKAGTFTKAQINPALFAPALDTGYVLVSINHWSGLTVFRRKQGTGATSTQEFRCYRFTNGKVGDQVGKTITGLLAEVPIYQGHFVIANRDGTDPQLCLPTGYGGANHPAGQELHVHSFTTGKKLYTRDIRVHGSAWPVQEPEGGGVDNAGRTYVGFTLHDKADAYHWRITYLDPKAPTPTPPTKETPMHPFAAAEFYTETRLLEGSTTFIYFDTHQPPLATTGLGNMIDAGDRPSDIGLSLPWRSKAGNYATEVMIDAEYRRLSALGIHAQGGQAYGKHASLFIEPPVVEWLFQQTATSMETAIAKQFPGWKTMPADAQLAVMSMAWNLGANFPPGWPNLTAALKRGDYLTASDNCLINGRPSERNRRNRILFLQAARTVQYKTDPAKLAGVGVTLKASTIAASDPAKVNAHAWWTQAMLRIAGRYAAPLDGLFGPMSKKAFGGPVTLAALTALSRATLNVTITG